MSKKFKFVVLDNKRAQVSSTAWFRPDNCTR